MIHHLIYCLDKMSTRANFVKSELNKIYNLLNESYENANIARLENDNRFIKIFEILTEMKDKSDLLRRVVKVNYFNINL